MKQYNVEIEEEKIAEYFLGKRKRKLSIFGSVLIDDFRPDSVIDVLVIL